MGFAESASRPCCCGSKEEEEEGNNDVSSRRREQAGCDFHEGEKELLSKEELGEEEISSEG